MFLYGDTSWKRLEILVLGQPIADLIKILRVISIQVYQSPESALKSF